MNSSYRYLGHGIYSISEAAALSGVAASKITRWILGYSFQTHSTTSRSEPVFKSDYTQIDGKTALSFLDLVEVQFVDWFRNCGVSWKSIRISAQRAASLLESEHPFAKRQFFTVRKQFEIDGIVSPLLYARLEFNDAETASRWWPRGRDSGVVVDPTLSFGQPVIERFGIPTRVIAQSYRSVGSEREVAEWFEIDVTAVKQALEFERISLVA